MKNFIVFFLFISLIVTGYTQASTESQQRQWALATSAVLFEHNHEQHNILPGRAMTDENVKQQKKDLDYWWGITSRKDLYEILQLLEQDGHRKKFERYAMIVSGLSEEDYQQLLLCAQDEKTQHELKVVAKYYEKLGDKSILGWDFARYVFVCRKAYMCGYLTEQEAWDKIMPVAAKLQATFDSWADLGENYLIGREFWDAEIYQKEGSAIKEAYEFLLRDPQSPWNRIPWDTPLDQEPILLGKKESLQPEKTKETKDEPVSFSSDEDLGYWFKSYYLSKNSASVPNAIKFMVEHKYFEMDKPVMPSYLGFFSEVFKENADKLQSWMPEFKEFSFEHMMYVYYALYWSNTKEGISIILNDLPKYNDDQKKALFNLLISYVPRSYDLYIEDITDASYLDMFWMKFFATGDKKPVQKIISILPDRKGYTREAIEEVPKDELPSVVIALSAQWSLVANAISNKEVLDIIQDEYNSTTDEKIKEQLSIILQKIEQNDDFEKNKDQAVALWKKSMALANDERYEESLQAMDEAIELFPNVSRMWSDRGAILAILDRPDEAIESFEKASELDPSNVNILEVLVHTLYEAKQYEKALKICHKVHDLKPDDSDYVYNIATLYCLTGDTENALKYVEKTIEMSPELKMMFKEDEKFKTLWDNDKFKKLTTMTDEQKDQAEAEKWYMKAKSLAEQNQHEESLEALDKAIEIYPAHSYAWCSKGVVLDQLHRFDDSIKAYEKALEIDPEFGWAWMCKGTALANLGKKKQAFEAFEKSTSLDPDNVTAWIYQGTISQDMERYDEAIKAFEKAAELAPDNSDILIRLGEVYIDLNQFDNALSIFKKGAELFPQDAMFWFNIGYSNVNLSRFKQGLEAYNKALEINPNFAQAWNNKSYIHREFEEYEEALAAVEKALELQPDLVDAWYNKGVILQKMGKTDEGQAAINKTMELGKNNTSLYDRVGMLMQTGNLKDALELINTELENSDASLQTYLLKGMILYEMKQYEDLLALSAEIIALDKDNPEGWIMKGLALSSLEKMDESLEAYNHALSINPDLPDALYNRACIYAQQGDKTKALKDLSKTFNIHPGFKEHAKTDEDLKTLWDDEEFKKLVE